MRLTFEVVLEEIWNFPLLTFRLSTGSLFETSQELQMLSSGALNYQVTKIVMNSGSKLSKL